MLSTEFINLDAFSLCLKGVQGIFLHSTILFRFGRKESYGL